ncbi:MAG: CoA ester lyase [Alphaproteobacteria bacterium]|nr:CoA ester lyase [Alphaproteobacteria bacterium]
MRSLLFVPADSERKLARGLESGADALILDLEDSVAAANRPTARKMARDFLEAHRPERVRRYVRINPLDSGMALDDLAATMTGRPDGVLLPKCLPADVRTLDNFLAAFEAANGNPVGTTRIIAIATETPAAMFALGGYAEVSPRLEGITWGAEDLAACIGGNNRTVAGDYDGPFQLARTLCLLAAANAGCMPIDTIFTDFRDLEGHKTECVAARRSGFTAKMTIHPALIPAINETFSVSDAERDWAERVLAAFAAQPDAGTLALDGKMIDKPHLVLARRLLGLGTAT